MKERKLGEIREKPSRFDSECAREGDDVEQSDVSLAAFDTSDVVTMKAGYVSEFFLREIPLETQFAQVISKGRSGVSRGHLPILLL